MNKTSLIVGTIIIMSLISTCASYLYYEEFTNLNGWTHPESHSSDIFKFFSIQPGKILDRYDIGGGLITQSENIPSKYVIQHKLKESFSNQNAEALILQANFRYVDLIECSSFQVNLIRGLDFDQYKMPSRSDTVIMFGVQMCGSHQKIVIDFNYDKKYLTWREFVKPPEQSIFENDFNNLHQMRLTIFKNKTYQLEIDGEVKLQDDFTKGWDFIGPSHLENQLDTSNFDYKVKRSMSFIDEIFSPSTQSALFYDENDKLLLKSQLISENSQVINNFNEIINEKYHSKHFRKEKNRDFFPGKHLNPHIFNDIQGVQVVVEENYSSFMIDSIILSDSVREVQQISKLINELNQRAFN